MFIHQFVFNKPIGRRRRFSQNFRKLIFYIRTSFLVECFKRCNVTTDRNIFRDNINLRIFVNDESSNFFLYLSKDTANQNQTRTIVVRDDSVLKIYTMIRIQTIHICFTIVSDCISHGVFSKSFQTALKIRSFCTRYEHRIVQHKRNISCSKYCFIADGINIRRILKIRKNICFTNHQDSIYSSRNRHGSVQFMQRSHTIDRINILSLCRIKLTARNSDCIECVFYHVRHDFIGITKNTSSIIIRLIKVKIFRSDIS